MQHYIDTEFIEKPGTLELISIGIASVDGDEYYAISSEFKDSDCNAWVKKNVLPKLLGPRKPKELIKLEIFNFITAKRTRPEFWGYFADYDWVLFCWLFGSMLDMPKYWPHLCLDVKQDMLQWDISKDQVMARLPNHNVHNALDDARWTREAHKIAREIWNREKNDE